MNLYERAMRSMAKTKGMRAFMIKVQRPLDMKLKGTRFTPSTFGTDAPLCYLTTTGRTSGEPRTVPLTYVDVGSGFAVVASNYGQDRHPAWSYNLDAHPRAHLEIDGTSIAVDARRATGDETDAIWSGFDAIWPGYETYREIAPRSIKVYVLEPVQVRD